MVLPTFLFIGPDKSGSTWMYEILRQHPECYVPPIKDIYFFDRNYDRGLEWYGSFFKDAPPRCRAIGELSHDYLFCPEAARRIHDDLPDVRLLTCLRDPVERTYSHYLYMIRSGRTRIDLEAALARFPELIENSRYHRHLSPYFRLFDRQRIQVLWFDRLRNDPESFAREIFRFLDIPFAPDIDYRKKVLAAAAPRSLLAAKLVKRAANVGRRARLERFVGRVKRSLVTRLLYRPYRARERPVLTRDARARLIEVFRPDVERLEALLDVDLAHWMDTPGGNGR